MANTYFRFKQFTIHQDKCAMKVCTDACLFGSLLPVARKEAYEWNVLDIGTGTGLLSLMYAQKNPTAILDAVEIDTGAALQAAENFTASPWKDRLYLHHCAIQQFVTDKKYDLIICNPPFYANDLRSPDQQRNLALHSSALQFPELIGGVRYLLQDTGIFVVLLPYHCKEKFTEMARQADLSVQRCIDVQQTPGHPFFRTILYFSRTAAGTTNEAITIMQADGQYTPAFAELLQPFYLKL